MRFKGVLGMLAAAISLVALAPTATATTQSRGVVTRNCSGSAEYHVHKIVTKGKPTGLVSDWLKGPGDVSISKGRSATSSESVTQTFGGGGGGGIDLGIVKAEYNASVSEAHEAGKSITKTLSETLSVHIPKHRTGRLAAFYPNVYLKVVRLHSNPQCHTTKKKWRVALPLKHKHLIFVRQLRRNH